MTAIDGSFGLAEVAKRQHGLFTFTDARSSGLSPSRLGRWVERGYYERVAPGVYAVAGVPSSWKRSVSAAVLTVGPGSAASHQTAAELWELISFRSGEVNVVTRRWDRVRRPFTVHESTDLAEEDVVLHVGIRVTTAHRTVVDLGATAPWLVEAALETGIRRGLFTLDDVESFVGRVARRGRRGVGVIRPLIEARKTWDGATESELEDLFRRVVTEHELVQPEPQFTLTDGSNHFVCRADFAYPDARVLIELDSEAHHMDRLTFRKDRSKQNAAGVLGWTMLRYTWWDLTQRPTQVIAELKPLLDARTPSDPI